MFSRLFPRSNNNNNNNNSSSNLEFNNEREGSVTPETSSRGEDSNHPTAAAAAAGNTNNTNNTASTTIPSSPLVKTTDGKTVVRLYIELLSCDDLGPDFTEDGKKVTKAYEPYVKVKLGGAADNKDSVDIHKTKPVQQRINTRDPIFDHEIHQSCFCMDGLPVDDLAQGLLFKVKDASATMSEKKQKLDVLGWALILPDALLWSNEIGGGGMDDSVPSRTYQNDLDHTLESELVHPTHLVKGLAGKIHIICRPASDQDLQDCRAKGWGYFQSYKPAAPTDHDDTGCRAATPPLQELL